MNDDWQAPGRSGTGSGQPPADAWRPAAGQSAEGTPGPGGGPPPPHNPYASPAAHAPAQPFATSDRHRQSALGSAGYTTPAYRNDSVAVTSLVLGIIGIVIPGVFLFAIAAGHLALRRLRTSYEGGRGLAVAGLVLGYLALALWASLFLLSVTSRMLLGF